MSQVISRQVVLGLAVSALAMTTAPATAQPTEPVQPAVSGITVSPPPRMLGRTSSGIPIEEVRISAIVRYADLNLRTPNGSSELDKRVKDAATSLCKTLEADFPNGRPDAVVCAKEAVNRAEPQVKAAKTG